MKHFFLCLIVSLVLVGCNPTSDTSNTGTKEVSMEDKINEVAKKDFINDNANLFSVSETRLLRKKLIDFVKTDEKNPRIFVLTVDSLGGQNIDDFSNAYFKKMKLGNKKYDNGVLIVIAKNDRKLRIEIGYGLEGKIPDSVANTIIRENMVPNLKKGSENWYAAVDSGITKLIALSGKE